MFFAGALAWRDPGFVTDPRFILVPPNFVTGLQNAQPPTAALVQGKLAALYSVTRDAARVALVGDDLGTIENGKLADLIVVQGDPLQDLRAAAAVRMVVKNGPVWTLDEILAPARTPAQLAARKLALEARQRFCRAEPQRCEEGGGHAH